MSIYKKYSLIDKIKRRVIIAPMYWLGVRLRNKRMMNKALDMTWDLIDKYVTVNYEEGNVN